MSIEHMARSNEKIVAIMHQALAGGAVGLPPARFAVELRDNQDSNTLAQTLHETLPQLVFTISPLSSLDQKILVVELPKHTLRANSPASVFAAAYALAESLNAAAVEPDLPTDIFNEGMRMPAESDSLGESLEDVLSECWSPPEPNLDDRPGWALDSIRAVQAWQHSEQQGRPSKGRGMIIAQPDTGVTAHAELDGVNFVPGFDFLGDDDDPTDPLTGDNPGHGTATASVTVSPSTLRITGSAPEAMHMPLRAIESVALVTQVTVARSIDWAVAHGATIITMSLGGLPSFSLYRALRRAVEADVIVLAAAGNCVRTVVWPARYDECLAVAGTNAADSPWRGSCLGGSVDISAPAQNVLHAYVPNRDSVSGDHIKQSQGTSFAVALTAGVAALWLAHHGRANLIEEARAQGETLQAMFRRLLQITSRRPRGWNSAEMGSGIVDAEALLRADLHLGQERTVVGPKLYSIHAETKSVASLIAETLGYDIQQCTDFDLHRFGQETALAIVSRSTNATKKHPEFTTTFTVTQNFEKAITDKRFRTWLGLNPTFSKAGPVTKA